MDTYNARRRRRYLYGAALVAGAVGVVHSYRTTPAFRSRVQEVLEQLAEGAISRLVSQADQYVDRRVGIRATYSLEQTLQRFSRDYFAGSGVASRLETVARQHLLHDVVHQVFSEGSEALRRLSQSLPQTSPFAQRRDLKALGEFVRRELTGTGTRLARLSHTQSIERTLQHVSFSKLHQQLGTEGVRAIARELSGAHGLIDAAITDLHRQGWFRDTQQAAIRELAHELRHQAERGRKLSRWASHLGMEFEAAEHHIGRVFPSDPQSRRAHPFLEALRREGVGRSEWSQIVWSPRVTFRTSGRSYDLSSVIQSYDHMLQWARHALTVPVAPGLASISPFRLFPWRERFRGMVAHLQLTTAQPNLAVLFGGRAGEPIGYDVLMVGRRLLGFRARLHSNTPLAQSLAQFRVTGRLDQSGVRVEGLTQSVEGRFAAHAVRGQALQEVFSAMTGGRARARAAGWEGTPETLIRRVLRRYEDHPIVRWLGLDRPNETDYFTRKLSAWYGKNDPEHPANLLQRLRHAAVQGVKPGESPELVDTIRRVTAFIRYNTRMDADSAIDQLLNFYRRYQGTNDPQLRERLSRVFDQQLFGHRVVDLLQQVRTRQGTIEALTGRGRVRIDRGVLSTFMQDPDTPASLRDAVQELLRNPGFAQMDRRVHSSHVLGELSDHLVGVTPLRDSIERFREGILLAAFSHDVRWGGEVLTRVFPSAETGLRAIATDLVDELRTALRTHGQLRIGVGDLVHYARRWRQLGAHQETGAYVLASVLHDIAESPGMLGANIDPLVRRFFSGEQYSLLEGVMRRMTAGLRTWVREGERDYGEHLMVLRQLPLLQRTPEGHIDVAGTLTNAVEVVRSMFTTDPERMSMSSVGPHFFALRLNQMLAPYGLGLPEDLMRTPGQAYLNLMVRRVLPSLIIWEGFRFIDHLMHATTRQSPSRLLGGLLSIYAQGVRFVADSLYVTPVVKNVVDAVPGLDLYWHPRTREEEHLYQKYGYSAVRRGRWWLLGSRSPWHGDVVEAYVPHFTRRMRSHWQAASNVDLAGGDWLMHQWWFNPVGAVADPDWWIRKHRKDRPYPVGGRVTDPYSPMGALAGVADPSLSIQEMRHAVSQGLAARENLVGVVLSTLTDTTAIQPLPARVETFLTAGDAARRQRGIARRIKRGRGAVQAQLEEFEIRAPGFRDGTIPVQYPYDATFRLAAAGRAVGELQGIYGWFGSLLTSPRPVLRWDDPSWAISRSRQFWESRLGGLDIIPWVGELNELTRRFLLRREASDVRINPLPNNMPAWLPGDLTPGVNFRRGDPYAKIVRGELRLPGEAYRWTNPHVFRRDLLAARASMLGKSEREMMETFLGLQSLEGDTGGYATIYGTKVHKMVQAELARQGLLLEEEREYTDPVHQVYGHPDLVLRDRHGRVVIGEIKTMGRDKFEQRRIFYEHYIQLQQYLHMTRSKRGILIYINRDDPSQVAQFRVSYNPWALRRAWNRLESVRATLRAALRSGDLNEGALYSDLTRFEILSDVAPFSPMWRNYQRVLQSRFLNDPGEVSSSDQYRYQSALERAALRRRANLTYAYRTREPDHIVRGRVRGVTETGLIYLEGVDRPIQLAGIHLDYVKLARLMREGGVTVDEQYRAIGIDTGRRSRRARQRRAEALRRLRETHSAQRAMGVTVRSLYAAYGIYPGARIKVSTVQPLRSGYPGPAQAVVSVDGASNVNRLMVHQGVARWHEELLSPMDYQARHSRPMRLVSRPLEWLVHRDTLIHNKLLRVRSATEEYERSYVYGSRAGAWEHPFRSFVWPTLTGIAAKHPVQAALYGGLVASLFFAPRNLKQRAALWGGTTMALVSLLVHLRTWFAGEDWKPLRTRKREEIEEYYDLLTYLKFRRLYLKEVNQAKRWERLNVDRLVQDLHRRSRRGEAVAVRGGLGGVPTVRGDRPLAHEKPLLLKSHAQRALVYRQLYERTLVSQVDLNRVPMLSSIPRERRELILETAEYGTPAERRRLYRLLPAHERRVVGHLLLGRRPRRHAVDIERALSRYTIPDAQWAGWRPEVDLEMLKIRTLQEEGLDPIESGYTTRQVRIADALTRYIEVPVYRARYQSPAFVRAQLHRLARDLPVDWYGVSRVASRGRLTGMVSSVRVNVERDTTAYLESQIDALEY